jgi:hypothetical protein
MAEHDEPEDWSHARDAAADRMRAFLWREGVALRGPVEQGLVSRDDAVRVVLEGFRKAVGEDAEALIVEALLEGGPSPQERAAVEAEQRLSEEVEALRPKPRAKKPALAPVRTPEDDAPPPAQEGPRERPHLRLASEDAPRPGSDAPQDPPEGETPRRSTLGPRACGSPARRTPAGPTPLRVARAPVDATRGGEWAA